MAYLIREILFQFVQFSSQTLDVPVEPVGNSEIMVFL